MYIRGIDFCIEHDYPTVEYIKGNFDRSLLHQNHIFVDEPVTGGDNGVYVLNGKCSGKFSFSKFTAATLHLRHDSELALEVEDCAKVFVSVYDRAKLYVRQSDMAKVYVSLSVVAIVLVLLHYRPGTILQPICVHTPV